MQVAHQQRARLAVLRLLERRTTPVRSVEAVVVRPARSEHR